MEIDKSNEHGVFPMKAVSVARTVRENPKLTVRNLNRKAHRRGGRWQYNRRGIDVMREDWDVLVILDACRYDLFESRHSLQGELERKVSCGSDTREFLRGNVAGRELHDVVYVTANPMYFNFYDELHAEIHDVILVEPGTKTDANGVVSPETMARRSKEIAERYPNKRLVLHFVQPHFPFLDAPIVPDSSDRNIWRDIFTGEIDTTRSEVWESYRKNFDRVHDVVKRLLPDLVGKIVVTSDHGNLIGERVWPFPFREWGHPIGLYVSELVTIPWLEVPWTERREQIPEPPISDEGPTQHDVDERLEALGYV